MIALSAALLEFRQRLDHYLELRRSLDALRYNFFGRHLIVLDGDAQIILDYIANVLPSH